MLLRAVRAIEGLSPRLSFVVLPTGTKAGSYSVQYKLTYKTEFGQCLDRNDMS